ncbi:polyprenyl synthetase family protein [candidate division KSB1 bacterium]|nr:polyprenyl synthetase family protein [candidate division KSB1 bacterium]
MPTYQIQLSQRLQEEIERRVSAVQAYVLNHETVSRFAPEDMREAVTCYFASGGKRLRPAVLLLCCGAVGGDEATAISVAAATEIFHTWTLVHDDIIDRDPMRRGQPTVHERFFRKPSTHALFGTGAEARHYGVSVAVLAGDVQHGWGISLMTELTRKFGVDAEVTLALINELDTRVLCTLVEGEMLDVQYSRVPIDQLTIEQIETMLWKKTGALYEFCGTTGAAIGLNTPNLHHPLAVALAEFCSACGAAFQLQDDILGLIGNEQTLGKPVGADIREGKRTVIARHAYAHATPVERELISATLGDPQATPGRIQEVTDLLVRRGGVRFTAERARGHVNRALKYLEQLPPTENRELLAEWAQLMIERDF